LSLAVSRESSREFLGRQDRHPSVTAREVTAADRFLLTRIEVCQRVHASAAVRGLFGEPDLVPADETIADRVAEDCDVMRVEDELRPTRVGHRILEETHQLRHQGRVEAGVQFVGQENGAIGERFHHRADESEPHKCAERLLGRLQIHVSDRALMSKAHIQVLEYGIVDTCRIAIANE
jgi:hypothetical protein